MGSCWSWIHEGRADAVAVPPPPPQPVAGPADGSPRRGAAPTPREFVYYKVNNERRVMYVYNWRGEVHVCRCSATWVRGGCTQQEYDDGALEAWTVITEDYDEGVLCPSFGGEVYTCPHCTAAWRAV